MWRDWFFTLFNGFVLEDIYVVVSHVFLQGETWGKSSVPSTCLLPSNPTLIGWSMAYLVAALPLNRRIRSSWLPNYKKMIKKSNILNGCWALVRSNWLLAHLVEFESLFCNNPRTGPEKKNRNSLALESELVRNCLINLKGHVLVGESYQVLHLFPINYVKLTVEFGCWIFLKIPLPWQGSYCSFAQAKWNKLYFTMQQSTVVIVCLLFRPLHI